MDNGQFDRAPAPLFVRARRPVAASASARRKGIRSGIGRSKVAPIDPAKTAESPAFLRGVAASSTPAITGRHTKPGKGSGTRTAAGACVADVLKALIKLAAAGVKVREGRSTACAPTPAAPPSSSLGAAGRSTSSTRARPRRVDRALPHEIAEDPPPDPGRPMRRSSRVFAFRIEIDPDCMTRS